MRLNKFIAHATGISRRQADEVIASGRVKVNDFPAQLGRSIDEQNDIVELDGRRLAMPISSTTIIMNKPVGYVCSRRAQGKGVKTIYELLPDKYKKLKTVGRLDKDSSGLIMLTDDGDLAFRLTHPKFHKEKQYLVTLNLPLSSTDERLISTKGVEIGDGLSKLGLRPLDDSRTKWRVTMSEGRNRQIRRTFAAVGYAVTKLHRVKFGDYEIGSLKAGEMREIGPADSAKPTQ